MESMIMTEIYHSCMRFLYKQSSFKEGKEGESQGIVDISSTLRIYVSFNTCLGDKHIGGILQNRGGEGANLRLVS